MHQENNAEKGGYAPKPAPLEEFNMKIRLYAVKEIEIDKNDDIIKEYIDNNYCFKEQDKYEQIGDAVPPLLAYAWGEEILGILRRENTNG